MNTDFVLFFLKMRQNWKETFWNLATFKIDIDSKLVKEEPFCDLNENSKVKEEDFDDFIENDDYIDDPDFDEDKPIKLPKKRKKSSESDQVIQTKTRLSQYQKSKLVTPDVNPKVVCPQLGRYME